MRLGRSSRIVADGLRDASYAELEEFALEVRRREILSGDLTKGAAQIVNSLLKAWTSRAASYDHRGFKDE